MNKYLEIKQEYDQLFQDIQAKIKDADHLAYERYCLSAIFRIWGSNTFYAREYDKLVMMLTGKDYSVEQVMSAVGCCSDPERQLRTPAFFARLVDLDVNEFTNTAAAVMEKLNALFVAAAMINGDFTIEEAVALTGVVDSLRTYAASAGLRLPSPTDNSSRVTARNEESYLQNQELVQLLQEEEQAEKDRAANGQDAGSASDASISPPASPAGDPNKWDEQDDFAAPKVQKITPAANNGEKEETMESLLAELNSLVGLEHVKQDVQSLINFIKVANMRKRRGMKAPTISYHLVFAGNPGTGKTTIARLVGKLYYHMGILSKGQLVEADRSSLVAGYLGQTALKTQKVIGEAMGGVLFIDEAYALAENEEDIYGKEAIETILKAMEDHRDELVVIVAGYTDLMHRFIDSNPGLSSRFNKYFEFPDYSSEELLSIFKRFCTTNGYCLRPEAEHELKLVFDGMYAKRDDHFGNARAARNLFEKVIGAQADRIAAQPSITDADLEYLQTDDILKVTGGNA